ncbi:MAG TPA: Ig-like domain-containing protein, partial [Candidatus Saccharimonadia bacterium]|nr:Ig-like domain-containing protein [Candidatus Saccharimonadia bacterium]
MRSCLRTIVCGVVALSLLIGAFGSVARVLPVHAGIGDTGVLDTETLSTNPKPRTGKITASVVDNQPPSVPILVSPENNALLSTNIFPFVWKESTDDRGVVKYQLYLDGNLLFDNISTSNSSTADYTHTSSGGVSSLTPKHALADGLHTWKIVAYDQVGNNASSTTWSFTIDTTAPVIVIKMIGDLVVSISSQDTSTIPTHPLILYANNPVISGTTEANAKVQLSFTPPGGSLTTLNTVAAANGSFSFTMPTLPRNVVILLTFVAQDAAGNTSTIDQVPIEIKTKTIIVPPPFNEIIPPIPVPQPAEIIQPVQQIIEKVIPPVVADTVSPIANSLIGLLIPLLRLAIALHFTGVGITLITVQLLRKAARALYLLPPQERMGLVYDVETHKGVPYALVKIFPVKDEDHLHVELPHEVKQFVT